MCLTIPPLPRAISAALEATSELRVSSLRTTIYWLGIGFPILRNLPAADWPWAARTLVVDIVEIISNTPHNRLITAHRTARTRLRENFAFCRLSIHHTPFIGSVLRSRQTSSAKP